MVASFPGWDWDRTRAGAAERPGLESGDRALQKERVLAARGREKPWASRGFGSAWEGRNTWGGSFHAVNFRVKARDSFQASCQCGAPFPAGTRSPGLADGGGLK